MAVERIERRLKLWRQAEGIEILVLPTTLLRHLLADVIPKVAEHRHLVSWDVVGDRNAWQLHDPALDRVHEREVTERPREKRPLDVP
jgi:hypothetical protein